MPYVNKDYFPIYEWASQQSGEGFTAYQIEKALGLPKNSSQNWLKSEAFHTHVRINKNLYLMNPNIKSFDDFLIKVKDRKRGSQSVIYRTYSTVAGEIELTRISLPLNLIDGFKRIIEVQPTMLRLFEFLQEFQTQNPDLSTDVASRDITIRELGKHFTNYQFVADIIADVISDPRANDSSAAHFAITTRKT